MSLPKKFTLGAVDWTINIDDNLLNIDDSLGQSDVVTNEIILCENYKGRKLTKLSVEQTLYHEVVHAILGTLNEFELCKNEEFVQKFSLLLHQFEKTKE